MTNNRKEVGDRVGCGVRLLKFTKYKKI